MIARLMGTVVGGSERSLVVDVAGVGYEVFCVRSVALAHKVGERVTLHTYHKVTEDSQELYGFPTEADLGFYRLLLTVSGVGPKSALNILDTARPEDIRHAVARADAATLHRVHGIGKKTAERLITELKDKLDMSSISAPTGDEASFVEAITGLGYSLNEAREALRKVGSEGTLAERVKQAIKLLSRG